MNIIELSEYESTSLPKEGLDEQDAKVLWEKYKSQISIDTPSFKNDNQWVLTAQGSVGFIPISDRIGISLKPKVPLKNLFGMLDYAYRLKNLQFPSGIFESDSLHEFYNRLASFLSKRILDRGRKGYYRTYISRQELLPHLRGRWDIIDHLNHPARIHLHCEFEDHTPDIIENHILLWTLSQVARSGLCKKETIPVVRRAFRSLQGFVQLIPVNSVDCVDRIYNRLNSDYRPLHILCRFFLDQSGPTHESGEKTMIPFLIDMASLYEMFVAEWLKDHLPPELKIIAQDSFKVGEGNIISWNVDLVLIKRSSGKPLMVLDTKYKKGPRPVSDDIQQVVAYAEAKGCKDSILIYPSDDHQLINEKVGDKRVRSLVFSIQNDLEDGGHRFLNTLLESEIFN